MPKSKKKHTLKETRFFMKMDLKVDLKVDPEIVKMPSRCVFWPIEKTLNSASLCFFHLLLSGTPGESQILQVPCKYHQIRDATLSHKNHNFLEKGVKSDPPATPKSTRNHKKLVLEALRKYVFLLLLSGFTN